MSPVQPLVGLIVSSPTIVGLSILGATVGVSVGLKVGARVGSVGLAVGGEERN